MLKLGITGVESSGKTSIFQLFTHKKISSPSVSNLQDVSIPDERLDWLSSVFKPKKTTYAKLKLLDPPGFTKLTLSLLQPLDALIYVIPCFGTLKDPQKSLQELLTELILRDVEICEGALEKSIVGVHPAQLLERCSSALLESTPLREVEFNETEEKFLMGFGFLSQKPAIVILNSEKNDVGAINELPPPVITFNAKLELEISELTQEERKEYEQEFGIGEPPFERFVRLGLPSLKITTFFTVVGDEVRAWQIPERTSVIKAAGKVHSDMERGFIRAQVIGFEDFKSANIASDVGQTFRFAKFARVVDRKYIVQDGDLIEFKFH